LATLAASVAQSQTVVTIGLATTGNAFPFNASTGVRYQEIYASNEIGLAAGATLTEIQVAKVGGSIATYDNFRLRLAHTTVGITGLTTAYDSNYQGALSVVLGDPNVPGTAPENLLPTSPTTAPATFWWIGPTTTSLALAGRPLPPEEAAHICWAALRSQLPQTAPLTARTGRCA